MCDTAFVCVHVLTYIISQPCINILVSKLIWVHLLWIYLLKKKAAGSLSTSSWQVEGRTLSLSHDALELLHIFAFVHTSVMKRPGSDFVVVVVNVTHIWVDLQIHLWSISADQNWIMAFFGGAYMSQPVRPLAVLDHGVQRDKPNHWPYRRASRFHPMFTHLSHHWLCCDVLT